MSDLNSLNRRDMLKSLATVAASPLLLSNFGCTVDRIFSPQFDAAEAGPFTLIGAGDQHAVLNLAARGRTAAQVKRVLDADPSALAFAIGDLTHAGHDIEYQQYYHQSWGQFKARTIFGIGNHDTMYALPRGAAYYAYTQAPKYYARTLGNNWRVYMLTCMNATEGGVNFTEQLAWLKADLAQYSASHHILAMVHYPMFASVCEFHLKDMTSKPRVGPMWEALQGAGCEFVVSGHAHRYERLRPMVAGWNGFGCWYPTVRSRHRRSEAAGHHPAAPQFRERSLWSGVLSVTTCMRIVTSGSLSTSMVWCAIAEYRPVGRCLCQGWLDSGLRSSSNLADVTVRRRFDA